MFVCLFVCFCFCLFVSFSCEAFWSDEIIEHRMAGGWLWYRWSRKCTEYTALPFRNRTTKLKSTAQKEKGNDRLLFIFLYFLCVREAFIAVCAPPITREGRTEKCRKFVIRGDKVRTSFIETALSASSSTRFEWHCLHHRSITNYRPQEYVRFPKFAHLTKWPRSSNQIPSRL